jgi:TIR domain
MAFQPHPKPVRLFLAFAYQDRSFYEDLVTQLASLKWVGMIDDWHEYEIPPAKDWQQVQNERLTQADIILLLISPDFIKSDYYYSVQMKQALERDAAGQARVLPILCRPVYLEHLPIARLQFLPRSDPRNIKAVSEWRNKDSAYAEIVKEVKKAITEFFGASPIQMPPQPKTATQPQGTCYLTYNGHSSYLISAAWSPTVHVWQAI